MAKVQIADVIVPEVFNPYVSVRSMELSALYQSGIISNNPELDKLAAAGGKLINMPYWEDLTGVDEVLSDSGPLTPDKMQSGKDVAVLFMRGKAWSANDLAKALSGDDPMREIADKVSSFWARKFQTLLLSILKGVFSATSMSGNKLDISGETGDAAKISASSFIDAVQKLGDAKERLTAVCMHSSVQSALAKLNLIQFVKGSDNVIDIPTYQGKRIIVDDGCPVSSGNYKTYIFGPGAIGLGRGAAPVPTETDRDSLAGDDVLINRQHFLLHPRGAKWNNASVAGSSPTNTETEDATNWTRVYQNKAIRIVEFTHKI